MGGVRRSRFPTDGLHAIGNVRHTAGHGNVAGGTRPEERRRSRSRAMGAAACRIMSSGGWGRALAPSAENAMNGTASPPAAWRSWRNAAWAAPGAAPETGYNPPPSTPPQPSHAAMKQQILERARRTVAGFLHRQYADATLGVLSVHPEVDGYGGERTWYASPATTATAPRAYRTPWRGSSGWIACMTSFRTRTSRRLRSSRSSPARKPAKSRSSASWRRSTSCSSPPTSRRSTPAGRGGRIRAAPSAPRATPCSTAWRTPARTVRQAAPARSAAGRCGGGCTARRSTGRPGRGAGTCRPRFPPCGNSGGRSQCSRANATWRITARITGSASPKWSQPSTMPEPRPTAFRKRPPTSGAISPSTCR